MGDIRAKAGDLGAVSKRPKMPIPDEAEKKKIKHSMGMNPHEKFFRCRGKSDKKVKEFEAQGDMSHSGKDHVCPDCRCSKVAGAHTEHYGLGKCFDHENCLGASRRNNQLTLEAQKEAITQGYPDKVYRYESGNTFIERVRQRAEESGGMQDLGEELNVLRGHMQKLMSDFEGRDRLTEGYDKHGCPLDMTDATYMKLINQTATVVAKLSATNLNITEADYVHVHQVNIWFANVIRILQRALEGEYPDVYKEIIEQIKNVPQLVKGRMK
jgi:hypothetical protein